MTKIVKYFAESIPESIQKIIQDAGGNEVFLLGHCDTQKRVTEVEVFARGNEVSAPALLQVARQGDVVIHNHPSGTLRPSAADMHVASILGNDGVGFFIVNQSVSDVYVVIEPFAEKEIVPVDAEKLSKILEVNGPISKKLERLGFDSDHQFTYY